MRCYLLIPLHIIRHPHLTDRTEQNNNIAYRGFNIDMQFNVLMYNVNQALQQSENDGVPNIEFYSAGLTQVAIDSLNDIFDDDSRYEEMQNVIKLYIKGHKLPPNFIDKYNLRNENVMCNDSILLKIEGKFVKLIKSLLHTLRFIQHFNANDNHKVNDKIFLENAAPDNFNKNLQSIAENDYAFNESANTGYHAVGNLDLIFEEGIIVIYFREILDSNVLNVLLQPQYLNTPDYKVITEQDNKGNDEVVMKFKYTYTKNDFEIPVAYFTMDLRDLDKSYNFYDDMITDGIFTNIIPDYNDSFDLGEYKKTLRTITTLRIFPTIELLMKYLFFCINRSQKYNNIIDNSTSDFGKLVISAQQFILNNFTGDINTEHLDLFQNTLSNQWNHYNNQVDKLYKDMINSFCDIYQTHLSVGAVVDVNHRKDIMYYTKLMCEVAPSNTQYVFTNRYQNLYAYMIF